MSTEIEEPLESEANPLRDLLLSATSAFRVGRTAEGSTFLIDFIDLLQRALQGLGDPEMEAIVLPHLVNIVAAQERDDFLRVADLLEFELQPLV